MIDPVTFLYWLMLVAWLSGLLCMGIGAVTDESEWLVLGVAIWLLGALPITIAWAAAWFILEALV